jgi:hypothetical protein
MLGPGAFDVRYAADSVEKLENSEDPKSLRILQRCEGIQLEW